MQPVGRVCERRLELWAPEPACSQPGPPVRDSGPGSGLQRWQSLKETDSLVTWAHPPHSLRPPVKLREKRPKGRGPQGVGTREWSELSVMLT